jgi:hypothetical protein
VQRPFAWIHLVFYAAIFKNSSIDIEYCISLGRYFSLLKPTLSNTLIERSILKFIFAITSSTLQVKKACFRAWKIALEPSPFPLAFF